jgi:hypothetical protein
MKKFFFYVIIYFFDLINGSVNNIKFAQSTPLAYFFFIYDKGILYKFCFIQIMLDQINKLVKSQKHIVFLFKYDTRRFPVTKPS